MIYLGSDHAGYELKEYIKAHLEASGKQVEDLGAFNDDASNYPEFANIVANKVAESSDNKGILFCRSGQGMAIAANRHKGIRAAVVWSAEVARESRNDNNANVLSLPAGYISNEEAEKIVNVWLVTPASKEPRHIQRNKQLDN